MIAEERGFPAVAALLKAAGSNSSTVQGEASLENFKGLYTTTQIHSHFYISNKYLLDRLRA
jgi:hypothetical protein